MGDKWEGWDHGEDLERSMSQRPLPPLSGFPLKYRGQPPFTFKCK